VRLGLFDRIVHSGRYQPELDGLRVLAILPVLWSHVGERVLRVAQQVAPDAAAHEAASFWVPRGFAGVHFFLLLSGFIIALPFLRAALSQREMPDRWQFLLRRLWRLAPPYLLVIGVIFLFLALTGYQPQATGSFERTQVPLFESFVRSSFFIFGISEASFPRLNPPGWSLEVEIHYYILFALIAPWLALQGVKRNCLIPLLILAATALALLTEMLWGGEAATFMLTRYLQMFLIGFAIALWSLKLPAAAVAERRMWDRGALLAVPAYVVLSRLIDRSLLGNGGYEVLCYMVFAVIFAATLRGLWMPRLLALPLLARLGGMTFTLYLIHMPIVQFLVSPLYRLCARLFLDAGLPLSREMALVVVGGLLIAAVLVAALPFYRFIERPFMGPLPGRNKNAT
jgi:peptidoglycan/LPS O-acetylase OafA/YrhL